MCANDGRLLPVTKEPDIVAKAEILTREGTDAITTPSRAKVEAVR